MTEIDDQICDEYVAGAEVPQLAARYGMAEEDIWRVLRARAARGPVKGHDWSLRPLGNRILYSVVGALVFYAVTGASLGLFAGVVAFLALSFLADRQAGSDRQP